MSLKERLKDYKVFHWAYNLLHYKSLRHNKEAYRQYNIHKPLYGSVSSKDFPDKKSTAWLDVNDSLIVAPQKASFNSFDAATQEQIKNWSKDGYLILEKLFDEATCDTIDKEVERLVKSGAVQYTHDNKVMFANKLSQPIKEATHHPVLNSLLGFLLDKEVVPFQTLNFNYGSGQKAHSDSIHMTTYPLGYLIAAWIALEDIHPDSGPLFYYPGSHKLPYLLNDDFGNISNQFSLGNKSYADYEEVTQDIIEKEKLQSKIFLPKKGDVLVWHANLIHGGMPVVNPSLTRKSMVIHFYARDVIKYHEITERPSLMEED
ncbi:MAG: phytanoyl-CoA dioxygenase family protein [Sphingobacteriales bacterium]|nr:phytanoyl-CoA dioxygenase family protein [Sphingobacteriales bacterium]MBI3718137.1 phytanoyl-CoA dioxygenase family protein [Sphingobacteriales bacterium]